MPSKIVYLKRAVPFVHESIGSDAMQSQLALTKRGVGGYYVNKHSTKMGTGLTQDEVEALLPQILSVPAKNPEFWLKVDDYYANINTLVPHGKTGLQLEIGLTVDNDKPAVGNNMPIAIGDYIKYRHALKHPDVGASPEIAKGNQLVKYYFEDPTKKILNQVNTIEMQDKAMLDYAQIKTDPERMNMILTLMRNSIPKEVGKPPIMVDKLSEGEKIIHLRELAISKPEQFHELAQDKELIKKYRVDELVSVGIIKRMGNIFVDGFSSEPLGSSLQEVILNLWNEKNSAMLQRFIAAYKEKKAPKSVLA